METRAPTIPRSDWTNHRNYPGQVLLLRSHASFRDVSRRLIEACDESEDHGAIGLYYGMWISGMRSHEAYEEHKLYPYLERFHGLEVGPLEAGHQALHRAEKAVREALEGRGDLRSALVTHDEVLSDHLEAEEDAVIPLLLEMDGREFSRFISQPIHRLLADA